MRPAAPRPRLPGPWPARTALDEMDSRRPERFVLIPGRSTEQGTSVGDKSSAQYRQVTQTLRVSPADLARLGLRAGDRVRLRTPGAEIEVTCASAGDELPSGMLFIAYGPESSKLLEGETHGTGMPDSKGIEVEMIVLPRDPDAGRARG